MGAVVAGGGEATKKCEGSIVPDHLFHESLPCATSSSHRNLASYVHFFYCVRSISVLRKLTMYLGSTVWCNEIGSLTSLMHTTQVHPVTTENQFHCARLYNGTRPAVWACLALCAWIFLHSGQRKGAGTIYTAQHPRESSTKI